MEARLPSDEAARLETLRSYGVLDTPSEPDFDDLVKLAAEICDAPISLVSLVDEDRQWFKGRHGLEVSETPRKLSFCAHAILNAEQTLVVPDALKDPRFSDNDLVTGPLGIRAYAGAPLVTPEGHALGTLCVIDQRPRDFTPAQKNALRVLGRQVQAQLELRRRLAELARRHRDEQTRLERWERVFEEADFGLVHAHAATNTFIAVNPSFARQRGYTPEELVNKPILTVYPPELRDRLKHVLAEVDRAGHLVFEAEHLRKDGSRFPVLMEVTVLRDAGGRPTSRIAYALDITELVAARESLARSHEELERQVSERTAQLVEANANLQSFAHMAAHDLRSPLRAISSFTHIIGEEFGSQLGPMGQSMLERVAQAAGQMTHLLNDLLEYSRMNKADLKLGLVSTETAVTEALGMLQQEIAAREAEISVQRPLPAVVGHRATVVLILSNLLSNGLKFMPPERRPSLRISAEPAGTMVRLTVQDNGIGIAAEDVERVFGVFERLHGKGAYPGTGLGLAIVKKAAERMGGRVGVDSTVGEGSRFWVELPAAPDQDVHHA